MKKPTCVVGRSQGGITLNPLEYLLDGNDELMIFEGHEKAKEFLESKGLSEEEIETFQFIEGHGFDCPKCESENTETYLSDRSQNCLDCGHEYRLSEDLAQEQEQQSMSHN